MAHFERISVADAATLIAEASTVVVDVRDGESYAAAHIPGARHLDESGLADFIAGTDPTQPVIVYCYHGISSQGAAAFLNEQGLDRTYSLDGGFEEWRASQPVEAG